MYHNAYHKTIWSPFLHWWLFLTACPKIDSVACVPAELSHSLLQYVNTKPQPAGFCYPLQFALFEIKPNTFWRHWLNHFSWNRKGHFAIFWFPVRFNKGKVSLYLEKPPVSYTEFFPFFDMPIACCYEPLFPFKSSANHQTKPHNLLFISTWNEAENPGSKRIICSQHPDEKNGKKGTLWWVPMTRRCQKSRSLTNAPMDASKFSSIWCFQAWQPNTDSPSWAQTINHW